MYRPRPSDVMYGGIGELTGLKQAIATLVSCQAYTKIVDSVKTHLDRSSGFDGLDEVGMSFLRLVEGSVMLVVRLLSVDQLGRTIPEV